MEAPDFPSSGCMTAGVILTVIGLVAVVTSIMMNGYLINNNKIVLNE